MHAVISFGKLLARLPNLNSTCSAAKRTKRTYRLAVNLPVGEYISKANGGTKMPEFIRQESTLFRNPETRLRVILLQEVKEQSMREQLRIDFTSGFAHMVGFLEKLGLKS